MVQEGGCPDFQTAVHLLTATCFTLAAYAAWLYLTLATIGSHEPAYWDRALVCVGGGWGLFVSLSSLSFLLHSRGFRFVLEASFPAILPRQMPCGRVQFLSTGSQRCTYLQHFLDPAVLTFLHFRPPPISRSPLPSPCLLAMRVSSPAAREPPPHSQGSREGALVVGSLGAKAMARPRLHPVPGADQAELSGPPRAGVPGTPGPTPPP